MSSIIEIDMKIPEELKDIINSISLFGENAQKMLPNTVDRIDSSIDHLREQWIDKAGRDLKQSRGRYVASITRSSLETKDNIISGEVSTNHPAARYIEYGTRRFDMKQALWTSDKVRISKAGYRYLIIPFQHGTQGTKTLTAMPPEIEKSARKLKSSKVVRTFTKPNINRGNLSSGKGGATKQSGSADTIRRQTAWGGRLTGLGKGKKKYEGMVKMSKSGGGKTHSAYLTFRVMSERSSGWINKGIQRPYHFVDRLLNENERDMLEGIHDAFMEDLGDIMSGARTS